ncbi:MAG: VacJ family lipoprotein [Desulfobulbaceae bacterium]|nr:VacJ family lipoprotein [Desulfobulbaceae bacterium]
MFFRQILANQLFITPLVCVFLLMPGTPGHAWNSDTDILSDDFYGNGLESEEYKLDRLEPFNRAVFAFNDKMLIWVMEPVATAYSHVVPSDLRACVYNFFYNLEEPVRFINTLLQGRFSDAGDIFVRFLINSTFGIYGLADAADREFSYPPIAASLGETFATWGMSDVSYLVVPFHGPSTVRDFTGTIIDGFAMTPYYLWTDEVAVKGGVYAGKGINTLSLHLGEYEELKQVFFDPYVGFRNAYFQYRHRLRDRPVENEENN